MEPPATDVDQLSARLASLEARAEIMDLIARYGPAVDSGDAESTAALWSEAGQYSYTLDEGTDTLHGRDGMRAMVHGPMHQGIIADGAGHLMGLPVIEVNGDHAVVTSYSTLVRHHPQDGSYRIDRLAANRWELFREAGQWQVRDRVNLLLDGRETARFLLGRVGESQAVEQ